VAEGIEVPQLRGGVGAAHGRDPLTRRGLAAILFIAICFAAGTAAALIRTPVQVSDALETILRASRSSSPVGAFTRSLTYSSQMLRPMDYAATNAVLRVAATTGTRTRVAFRAVHASLACLLFALFTLAARPRIRTDLVVFPVALTMLVGLHSFAGMMREAYPINHFLLVSVGATVVYAAAQSRGGLLTDVAAVATFAFCLLSVESGILILVVALSAWLAGWRGISRAALGVMLGLVIAYLGWRIGYLHIRGAGVGDHSSGFGNTMLSTGDQIARFGAHPFGFFAYNMLSAVSSLLFSEPRDGVYALIGIHQAPSGLALPPPSIFIEIASSVAATSVLIWGVARWRAGALADAPAFARILLVAAAVAAASGAISYSYNKDEIISTAGVFYVLAVAAALREAVLAAAHVRGARRAIAGCVLIGISLIWGWRAIGFEYKMLRSATFARNEWARVVPGSDESRPRLEPIDYDLARELKTEADAAPVVDYQRLPHWMERYWGE
jgi:hypothetical protein